MCEHEVEVRALWLIVAITLVAVISFVCCHISTDAAAVGSSSAILLMPVPVLWTVRWQQKITEEQTNRGLAWLMPACVGVLVAGANPRYAAAIVLSVAGAYMVIQSLIRQRSLRTSLRWTVVCGATCAVWGVLLDGSRPLGWNSAAFLLFGMSTFGAYERSTRGVPPVRDGAMGDVYE